MYDNAARLTDLLIFAVFLCGVGFAYGLHAISAWMQEGNRIEARRRTRERNVREVVGFQRGTAS